MKHPRVLEAVADAEARLGASGRVLLRLSGTEPLVRVMAEGEDEVAVRQIVSGLCEMIQSTAAAEAA